LSSTSKAKITLSPAAFAGRRVRTVFLIDPFAIAYSGGHALNWLDTLDPDHPDVVSRAGTLADMLVVRSGFESEPHWNGRLRPARQSPTAVRQSPLPRRSCPNPPCRRS
jgi:hypothetical protein